MVPKNTFKKSVKTRECGHYWVKWAGLTPYYSSPDIWRMGKYYANAGWMLPGEERVYQDSDFIEINENRIPFTKGRLFTGWLYWITTAINLIAFGYYAFYLLTHR